MRTAPGTKHLLLVVFVAFLSQILLSPPALAAWTDRSSELEGDDSNTTTYLIIGGAVLVGAIIVYKLATRGSDEDDEDSEEDSADMRSGVTSRMLFGQKRPESVQNSGDRDFGLLMNIGQTPVRYGQKIPSSSRLTAKLGVVFRF